MRRLKANSPQVIDIQMRMPDASSYTWRKKMEASSVFQPTNHVINNVFDPGHSPVLRSRAAQSFKGTGFGGRVQDASTYTMGVSATAVGRDNFTGPRIQTVTVRPDGTCLSTPPASQVVSEEGNFDGSTSGLNMGYKQTCAEFNPLTKSYFVDTIPEIKTRKIGHGAVPVRNSIGVDYGQNEINCVTTSTSGADGVKDNIPVNLHSTRPAKTPFMNSISGPQVGGGNYPGQRAPKVGGALSKIPEVSGSHGFAGYSPHVPTPFVPPNYAPAHLKINKAPRS